MPHLLNATLVFFPNSYNFLIFCFCFVSEDPDAGDLPSELEASETTSKNHWFKIRMCILRQVG